MFIFAFEPRTRNFYLELHPQLRSPLVNMTRYDDIILAPFSALNHTEGQLTLLTTYHRHHLHGKLGDIEQTLTAFYSSNASPSIILKI